MGDLIETPGERPVIAVTLGDPAGIGPEVVLKALADPTIAPLAAWTIVGDRDQLERAGEACGIPLNSLRGVSVRHLDALHGQQVVPGKLDAACGARRRRLRTRSHRHVPAPRGDRHGDRAGQQGSGRALRTCRSPVTPSSSPNAAASTIRA